VSEQGYLKCQCSGTELGHQVWTGRKKFNKWKTQWLTIRTDLLPCSLAPGSLTWQQLPLIFPPTNLIADFNYCSFHKHANSKALIPNSFFASVNQIFEVRRKTDNRRRHKSDKFHKSTIYTMTIWFVNTELRFVGELWFLDEINHLLPDEIVEISCIGKTFVHKILKLYRETNHVWSHGKFHHKSDDLTFVFRHFTNLKLILTWSPSSSRDLSLL
jgi:hypothetical protein